MLSIVQTESRNLCTWAFQGVIVPEMLLHQLILNAYTSQSD